MVLFWYPDECYEPWRPSHRHLPLPPPPSRLAVGAQPSLGRAVSPRTGSCSNITVVQEGSNRAHRSTRIRDGLLPRAVGPSPPRLAEPSLQFRPEHFTFTAP